MYWSNRNSIFLVIPILFNIFNIPFIFSIGLLKSTDLSFQLLFINNNPLLKFDLNNICDLINCFNNSTNSFDVSLLDLKYLSKIDSQNLFFEIASEHLFSIKYLISSIDLINIYSSIILSNSSFNVSVLISLVSFAFIGCLIVVVVIDICFILLVLLIKLSNKTISLEFKLGVFNNSFILFFSSFDNSLFLELNHYYV